MNWGHWHLDTTRYQSLTLQVLHHLLRNSSFQYFLTWKPFKISSQGANLKEKIKTSVRYLLPSPPQQLIDSQRLKSGNDCSRPIRNWLKHRLSPCNCYGLHHAQNSIMLNKLAGLEIIKSRYEHSKKMERENWEEWQGADSLLMKKVENWHSSSQSYFFFFVSSNFIKTN